MAMNIWCGELWPVCSMLLIIKHCLVIDKAIGLFLSFLYGFSYVGVLYSRSSLSTDLPRSFFFYFIHRSLSFHCIINHVDLTQVNVCLRWIVFATWSDEFRVYWNKDMIDYELKLHLSKTNVEQCLWNIYDLFCSPIGLNCKLRKS